MRPPTRLLGLAIVLCACVPLVYAKISDKRMCADPQCQVPISEGVTNMKYTSRAADIMSCGQNANVLIFSKGAGTDPTLWGVEIKGKRGYLPARFLRETKVLFNGQLAYEVSTAEEQPQQPLPDAPPLPSEGEFLPPTKAAAEQVVESIPSDSIPEQEANAAEAPPPAIDNTAGPIEGERIPPTPYAVAPEPDVQNDAQVVLEKIPNLPPQAPPVASGDPVQAINDNTVPATAEVPVGEASNEPGPQKTNEEAKIEQVVETAQKEKEAVKEIVDDDAEEDYDDEDEEDDEEDEEEEDEDLPAAVNQPEAINPVTTNPLEAAEVKPVEVNAQEAKGIETPPPLLEILPKATEEVPQINDQLVVEKPAEAEVLRQPVVEEVKPVEEGQVPVEIPVELPKDVPVEIPLEMPLEQPKESDLPTPPSNLLGNILNMNTGVPIPTHLPPAAMYFEQVVENGEKGDLENITGSVQKNETDPIVPELQPDQPGSVPNVIPPLEEEAKLPQYLDLTVDHLIEPLPPVASEEVQGTGETQQPQIELPSPGEGFPPEGLFIEDRTPPAVRENLENSDFYQPQVPNSQEINAPVGEEVPAEALAPPYLYPPPSNIPSYAPPPPVEYHGNEPPGYQKPDEEEVVAKEAPLGEVVEEKVVHPSDSLPDVTTDVPNPTTLPEPADQTVPNPVEGEEQVETGPGFFENLLTNAKSVLAGIDLTGMFRAKDGQQESVIIGEHVEGVDEEAEYCEQGSPNSCPGKGRSHTISTPSSSSGGSFRHPTMTHRDAPAPPPPPPQEPHHSNAKASLPIEYEAYLARFLESVISMTDLIICMSIVALTLLLFTFLHCCFARSQKENHFVGKLNVVERQLMQAMKQNQLLDADLADTKHKLASIEDSSFGSNDMVMALRRQLEQTESVKEDAFQQVAALEKELETAAEAGLELNRMVSELLSNQQGSEIISSVEGLQAQLNEQQETIQAINTLLAEKSRENSELLVELAEVRTRCEEEETGQSERLAELAAKVAHLAEENAALAGQLAEKEADWARARDTLTRETDKQLAELRAKNLKAEARVEALEESLKLAEGSGTIDKGEMAKLMSVARVKTSLLAAVKERDQLAEKLETESRQMTAIQEEVQRLRTEYNEMEKEKLEATTKLGILSSYFKDKETQLQKELSVKEAQCMQQQGETTSTVEKIRAMQEEIQTFKSQNESLKNEIEVQDTTHKAQILALENRAHESWLATRQTERRLEEVRTEAAVLRRKLTAMAEGAGLDGGDGGALVNGVGPVNPTASSPLHMDGPGSPIMPPLPGFLPPPPFMAPPPPHGFMPPPPFEMRPPPLGRLMSPPPGVNPGARYSPHLMDRGGRFSPHRGPGGGSTGGGRYTPDSRYDHFSPYETETDISPPPSPPHFRSRHSSGGSGNNYNNSNTNSNGNRQHHHQQQQNPKKFGGNAKGGNHRSQYSDRSDEFV